MFRGQPTSHSPRMCSYFGSNNQMEAHLICRHSFGYTLCRSSEPWTKSGCGHSQTHYLSDFRHLASLALVQLQKLLEFWYRSTFVCIWLTRLKRFVSQITDKLCNQLFYLATFNTSCMRSKIRCDGESCKVLEFWMQLNKGSPWTKSGCELFVSKQAVAFGPIKDLNNSLCK